MVVCPSMCNLKSEICNKLKEISFREESAEAKAKIQLIYRENGAFAVIS